ncbi:hypothetical protein UJ101_02715 [Flavobacteriaceae bacterium UJ101]|nr:hypothetical protein UJ101_02715 [Flavobacteriaceae bacterium UJ101]
MQESLKKITSFLLVILVMLSSTSFIIKKHECPKMTKHEKVKQKDCCSDENKCCTSTVVFEKDASSIDFISTDISFDFSKKLWIQDTISFINLNDLFIEIGNKKKVNYIDFYPPDLPQKIYILHETFLI